MVRVETEEITIEIKIICQMQILHIQNGDDDATMVTERTLNAWELCKLPNERVPCVRGARLTGMQNVTKLNEMKNYCY